MNRVPISPDWLRLRNPIHRSRSEDRDDLSTVSVWAVLRAKQKREGPCTIFGHPLNYFLSQRFPTTCIANRPGHGKIVVKVVPGAAAIAQFPPSTIGAIGPFAKRGCHNLWRNLGNPGR